MAWFQCLVSLVSLSPPVFAALRIWNQCSYNEKSSKTCFCIRRGRQNVWWRFDICASALGQKQNGFLLLIWPSHLLPLRGEVPLPSPSSQSPEADEGCIVRHLKKKQDRGSGRRQQSDHSPLQRTQPRQWQFCKCSEDGENGKTLAWKKPKTIKITSLFQEISVFLLESFSNIWLSRIYQTWLF